MARTAQPRGQRYMNANPQLARTRTPALAGLPTQESALRNDVSVSDRVADAVSDARSDSEVSGHWGPIT